VRRTLVTPSYSRVAAQDELFRKWYFMSFITVEVIDYISLCYKQCSCYGG